MGLLQRAVETYDCHREYVGRIRPNHAVLVPVSHSLTSAQIEITLDADGNFIGARAMDKSEPKIVIPVTEGSAGRSGTRAFERPHPLCDFLSYLIDDPNYYIPQLERWAESEYSHPKVRAVFKYIQKGTIRSDLLRSGILEADASGSVKAKKDMVCWRILELSEDDVSACWEDQTLFQAYIAFLQSEKQDSEQRLCMITGAHETAAVQHPKGILPINGNAKLISANDTGGFTYRGRFSEDWQAATVSYAASQKAHNALRWLASEQGVIFGGRTFICWNPQGLQVQSVVSPFRIRSEIRTEPTEYRRELWETLAGLRTELPENAGVVIVAFDAATTGRLSVTYYNELLGSDFLQRLYDWDLTCCWQNGRFGIQSPPLKQIVDCAFGTQRTEKNQTKLVADDKILRQQMQRLISCRVDRARVPLDMVKSLVNRASCPQAYDMSLWRKLVFTTCAVLNKYESDRKGGHAMAWTLDTQDRSFQYGRLLAAMERVEQDYYRKTNEDRQTAAIKALSEFRQRPWSTYERVSRHLTQAYLPRVEPWQRARYTKLKDEIIEMIRQFPESDLNKSLSDVYLLGYDMQHAEFYKSNKNNAESEEETE